jgi:hydroxymethylpyrimidine/phosphomethylpyrimidine kinase
VTPPVALAIAGSDSGGGAGLQADMKTFAALGVHGATVVTAITAQNTVRVSQVVPVAVDVVRAQLDAVLADLPVRAVKTGLLATADVIDLVAGMADEDRLPNLVVDPVMTASVGERLLDADAASLYRTRLLPLAAVFTPNCAEAQVLLGRPLHGLDELRVAAGELAAMTDGVVVVTGGESPAGDDAAVIDVVAERGDLEILTGPRVVTTNSHGTGCTFASAIAAHLARGLGPREAVRVAKQFVCRALEGAAHWQLGSGSGPLDHFHSHARSDHSQLEDT